MLQHLGIYEDALAFCPWLETAEWLDSRGARNTAKWLDADPFVIAQLSSPIDGAVLRFDFTRIEAEADVHFAHRQGFIAKTTATDPARLKQLLSNSRVS